MSSEYEKCLKINKIRQFVPGPSLVNKELDNARVDFEIAQKSFSDDNYKWSIIQTYYSMFHSARALLYSKSLREKSHHCLIESMRTLFVNKRLLSFELVEAMQKAKNLREDADYYGDFSKDSADILLKNAELFYKNAKKLLKK